MDWKVETMTESLERAFDVASQLPETEQDAIANWLLAELESEKNWSLSKTENGNQENRSPAISIPKRNVARGGWSTSTKQKHATLREQTG